MSAWRLNEATESCRTVFDRAWGGEPQIIMRDEKPMVVVLSFAAYEATKPKKRTLLTTLRSCPCGDELAKVLDERTPERPSYFERTGGFGSEDAK